MIIEDWAASGMAALTGPANGPPDFSRAPVLAEARATLARFVDAASGITGSPRPSGFADLDAGQLLTGRAALNRSRRGGRVSPGGGTRLIAARDDWVAITLSRESDIELLPALFSINQAIDEPWETVEAEVAGVSAMEFVERARLLGLPAARLGEATAVPPRIRNRGARRASRTAGDLVVADLSSLWAGPLCGQLLVRMGARVIKVESPYRPDGTRRGNPYFFDWVNGGKLSCTVDFASDRDRIAALLARADVVIEASRPRTLCSRGLGSEQLEPRSGQVWVRITAHGPDQPGADWVGFGDDTAVAGGLVARAEGGPAFCGDAIADPLTGLEAAMLAVEALEDGGGRVIDVSLAHVAARYAALGAVTIPERGVNPYVVQPRFTSSIERQGPVLGADNAQVDELIDSVTARSTKNCE